MKLLGTTDATTNEIDEMFLKQKVGVCEGLTGDIPSK